MHSYVISSMKPFKKLKHLLCTTTCLLDFLQKENYCIFHLCSVKLQKIKKKAINIITLSILAILNFMVHSAICQSFQILFFNFVFSRLNTAISQTVTAKLSFVYK